jgi:hypothetical protein
MTPLDILAPERRWVAWRNELRGGKLTKVPYSPHTGHKAKADDPRTWNTRSAAEACAHNIVNGLGGGIGIELGDLGDSTSLGGIDLDTCLSEGMYEPWAVEVITRIGSYTEVSPSGTGAKIFFRYQTEDLPKLRGEMGGQHSKMFKRANGADHPPAIELHLSHRYFTTTEQRLDWVPDRIVTVPTDTLLWILKEAGPAFAGAASRGGTKSKASGGFDKSRSAAAFRKASAMRRACATFEAMCQALRNDPETAPWCREKGDTNGGRELKRIWNNAAPDSDALPMITVRAGLRHEAADAGLAALEAAGTAFYQRGEQIVRVSAIAAKTADGTQTIAPGIVPVGNAALGRELGRAARWEKFDRKGNPVRIDPPRPVVEQIADMAGGWPFRILAGVIGTPTMRSDGSLLLDEGYDDQTGLVLLGAPVMASIPEQPTRADAERALQILDGLLDEFPFRDGGGTASVDRAVALSALLTPVLRGAMPAAPMHLVNAPQPGTGKSYLADLSSCIATGERCAVVAFSPNPEENEKRLNGSALGGHPILALDNASGTIEGDLLCQLTERPLLQLRPLGTSRMVRVANTFTVLANGNNAQVAADMVRRTIECWLDANMETPEMRVFRGNPLATIARHRGTYVAAALTIARAYFCAGKPGRLPVLASYEAWSVTVRSPLVWLGRADPVDSMTLLRTVDPVRLVRISVVRAWADELGTGGAYLTADVINRANDQGAYGTHVRPNLHAALLEIGRDRAGRIDPIRVGKWLSRNENIVTDGLRLTCDRGDAARPRWVLREA